MSGFDVVDGDDKISAFTWFQSIRITLVCYDVTVAVPVFVVVVVVIVFGLYEVCEPKQASCTRLSSGRLCVFVAFYLSVADINKFIQKFTHCRIFIYRE